MRLHHQCDLQVLRRKFLSYPLVEPEPNTVILTVVGTCIVLILIIVGIITHYAFSKPSQVRRGAIQETRQSYDGVGQYNQQVGSSQQDAYQACLAGAPLTSLESFNSLYNLPPGFIERKTPGELDYERRVMSTRLAQHANPLNSPRAHSGYLSPQEAWQDLGRSASG